MNVYKVSVFGALHTNSLLAAVFMICFNHYMKKSPDQIKVLFRGGWSYRDVNLREINTSRLVDDELEDLCQESWMQMLTEATEAGKKLWDSVIYRFEFVITDGSSLDMGFSTIPFSVRLGMNYHTDQVKRLGGGYMPQGIYSSCFVKTTDDQYVFIEKSNKYFTQKKIAFVGGVLSKSEIILNGGLDLFLTVKKEIQEEVGILVDVDRIRLRAGYLTENFNVCFLFEVSVPYTFAEVRRLFKQHNDGEAKEIFGLPNVTIASHISLFEPKDAIKFKILNFFS